MALLARARQRDPRGRLRARRGARDRTAAGGDPDPRHQGDHQRRRAEPGRLRAGVPRRGRGGRGDAARRRDRGRRPDAASSTRSATPERPTCSPASRSRTTPMTMNAYLGARPIAEALGGRCGHRRDGPQRRLVRRARAADARVRLAATRTTTCCRPARSPGTSIECGPQCTGGNFTDWDTVPGWDDMGYPVAECFPDGSAIITKPRGHRRPGLPGHRRRADPLRDRRPRRLRDARRGLRLARRQARVRSAPTASGVSGATGSAAAGHLQGHRHPRRRLPRDDDGDVRRHRRGRQGPPRRARR